VKESDTARSGGNTLGRAETVGLGDAEKGVKVKKKREYSKFSSKGERDKRREEEGGVRSGGM